jgi:hypothetical protein
MKKPKLVLYRTLKTDLRREVYVTLLPSINRKLLTTFRAGASNLRIETGRRVNEPRELRTCRCCVQNLIEDEAHFLLYCPTFEDDRSLFFYEVWLNTWNNCRLRPMLVNDQLGAGLHYWSRIYR